MHSSDDHISRKKINICASIFGISSFTDMDSDVTSGWKIHVVVMLELFMTMYFKLLKQSAQHYEHRTGGP
jgi:hypothetical protein